MIKNAVFLGLFSLGMTSIPSGTTISSLQNYADNWVKDPFLTSSGISLYVYDLNNNQVLAEINPNMSLVPASTMKLVTTASALEILGSGYRFKTRIQYTGKVDSVGVLHGNIYILGGSDPSLGSGYYSNFNEDFLDQWVGAIQEAGIKSIDGRIIADASILGENTTPSNWSWGDMGNYYGASPCGLTIYDNMTTISFKSGLNAGDSTWIVNMDPYIPELTIYNKVKAANSNSDDAYIYGGLYDPNRIAEGSIPKGKTAFEVKISNHDPAYTAAHYLETRVKAAGIKVAQHYTTIRRQNYAGEKLDTLERKTIHELSGASIGNLCYHTNMRSVNLFAEHMFLGIGLRYYGDGSISSSSKGVESYWQKKGVNLIGMEMSDGSGLSRSNAISAKQLALILKHMSASKNAETFKNSLSVAGTSGTLWSIGKNTKAEGNLIGKSGSMNKVRSYAGYVTSASGSPLVFAIIVNNYTCTGYQMKQRLEEFMVTMANYSGNQ